MALYLGTFRNPIFLCWVFNLTKVVDYVLYPRQGTDVIVLYPYFKQNSLPGEPMMAK